MRKRDRRLEEESMRLVSSSHIKDDEELRVIVRREEDEMEDVTPEPSPPKKRRLEDDDAELLEMRRKESLMKRTDKELLKKKEANQQPAGRKIVNNESDIESNLQDDSETSLSDAETGTKEPEPTFIVTMDGIDDYDFKGGAKEPIKTKKEDKSQIKSLARRKAESLASESKASSDAELELHADVSFDDAPVEKTSKRKEMKVKKQKVEKNEVKKEEVQVKPTMKVAARKRSPILPPTNGGVSQPVAAVKPIQAATVKSGKGGGAAKLAASYAAKLSEIKAAKAAKQKKGEIVKEITDIKEESDKVEAASAKKVTPVTAPAKASMSKPKPAAVPASAATAPKNKSVPGVQRKPITAPSPDRSSAVSAPAPSKLSYGDTATSFTGANKYKWKAAGGLRNTSSNGAPSKYSWKAANKIEY